MTPQEDGATGPTVTSPTVARGAAAKCFEKEDGAEEETREAELRRAQDQLQVCLEEGDYEGAVAVQESIAALTGAEPCSECNH